MKYILKTFFIVLLMAVTALSCTKGFDGLNSDPTQITPEQLEVDFQNIGSLYKPIFENIYRYDPAWVFQLQQNLNADVYSGYMTNPRPFVAGANNTTYNLVAGWNNFIWTVPYQNIMNNTASIAELTETEYPNFYAVSLILKVEAMHRVSDIFGPIVYSKYGESVTTSEYDSQEVAYNTFFTDLDTAVASLKTAAADDTKFAAFDMAYGGDYAQWVKFANSLRLRLAIRISSVDPAKAKIEGEKALDPVNGGLLAGNGDNFLVHGSLAHPLSVIDNSWGDIRMNASMESILTGYGDGRIAAYFDESVAYAGERKGIRNGNPLFAAYADELAQKADYIGFSTLNDRVKTSNVQLMTAAEVYFLKAEAALRGWANAGDVQANYEAGIATSFEQHSIGGVSTYISDNTSTFADYVDPVTASNSIAALSDVTIAWEAGASDEVKLEKIITQKWIAMFPEGQEAWSEFRRTGYPKIFPVVSNQSGGTIDTDIQIRRIPFAVSEYDTNAAAVSAATGYLNGADNGGTRLWWDTGSNF